MSFTEPLSLTVAPAAAVSLPRTSVGKDTSSYRSADGLLEIVAQSVYGRRSRRSLRCNHSKVVPDPLVSSVNVPVGMSIILTIDTPRTGYTAVEALALYTGFKTLFSASSDTLITKLLGGES